MNIRICIDSTLLRLITSVFNNIFRIRIAVMGVKLGNKVGINSGLYYIKEYVVESKRGVGQLGIFRGVFTYVIVEPF